MDIDLNGMIFLGRLSERLHELIQEQSAEILEAAGIQVPVKSCSLVLALHALAPASASDLARTLDCSHQLILQKLPHLKKLGLIASRPDPDDSRRQLIQLTPRGKAQVTKLHQTLPEFEKAYAGLFQEVGDVEQVVSRAIDALRTAPLQTRIGGTQRSGGLAQPEPVGRRRQRGLKH